MIQLPITATISKGSGSENGADQQKRARNGNKFFHYEPPLMCAVFLRTSLFYMHLKRRETCTLHTTVSLDKHQR